MTRQLTPIESVYRGITFRSRMEAQSACLLDHIGMSWQYEPISFVLPSGIGYTPDFVVTLHNGDRICIESRGYCSDSSIRQIGEFGRHFRSFGFLSYVAIGPYWCNVWLSDGTEGGALISQCDECGNVQFCRSAHPYCMFGCEGTLTGVHISIESGKISINGRPPGAWTEDATFSHFHKDVGLRV